MNYLLSDKNTLIWLVFTIYAVSALFIVPAPIGLKTKSIAEDNNNERSLQFASRFILRVALIFPMLLIIENII